MAQASLIQTNFNAGEWSPRMTGRVDLDRYRNACEELLNFVPLPQGPATKRSGSYFAGTAAATAARLIPFEYNTTQAYVIEASEEELRFYTNNGRIETSPGVPYAISAPWPAADLGRLAFVQSADVLYLAHGDHQTRKLSRTSATTFALASLTTQNGPFKDQNTDEAVTVYASAATGTGITLTASSGIFTPGHVGALFEIEQEDFSTIQAWEPEKSVAVNDKRRSDAKAYLCAAVSSANKTGTVQPTHAQGAEWDGMGGSNNGAKWTFLHGTYGIVRITAYTSATQVTADVVQRLPDGVVGSGNATWRWAHAVFSDAEGWPTAVAIWQERLILARGVEICGSVVGDYENFASRDKSGQVTADSAFRVAIASPRVDEIQWLVADKVLLIGTAGGELIAGPVDAANAIGPANIQIQPQSYYGAAGIRPVQVGARNLFVQRQRRKVREVAYDFNVDRYVAPDITILSEHVTASGLVDMAYQQEPDALLWCVRADGLLACFTYNDAQEVRGWSRHQLGGRRDAAGTLPARVLAVACIPDPAGALDQAWLLVERWIDGAAVRHVEYLKPLWVPGSAQAGAFHVDCGLSYDGAPATIISGLDHLEGETVRILADGACHPDRVVSGGAVTLDAAASTVHVGLPMTARLTTMRLEGGAADGTAQGKTKRVAQCTVRLLEALSLRYRMKGAATTDELMFRSAADAMDAVPPLWSGDRKLLPPGGSDDAAQLVLESDDALPCTIVAIMPVVQTHG